MADACSASSLPTALGGIVTGTTLASPAPPARRRRSSSPARSSGRSSATDPSQPVASIPVIIFEYSESPDKNLNAQAWAAAFVLITFVLVTSMLARLALERQRRKLGGAG